MTRIKEAVACPVASIMAVDLAILLAFSAGVVLTVGVLKTPLQLPGHSAILWMPILLLAGSRRVGLSFGSALVGGGVGVVWGFVKPLELSTIMAVAAVIEALRLSRTRHSQAVMMLMAGVLGNLTKLGLKVFTQSLGGGLLNHAGLALLPTVALYTGFGLLAGMIAAGLVAGWRRVRSKSSERKA
ncbi:MAG: hypothetical protein ACUVX8_00635 [Candidatus Zipacnadales bacterium]